MKERNSTAARRRRERNVGGPRLLTSHDGSRGKPFLQDENHERPYW
jgi:hypothetical protein